MGNQLYMGIDITQENRFQSKKLTKEKTWDLLSKRDELRIERRSSFGKVWGIAKRYEKIQKIRLSQGNQEHGELQEDKWSQIKQNKD